MEKPQKARLMNVIKNNLAKVVSLVIWLAANVAMAWYTIDLCNNPSFYYSKRMLGLGLVMARATASLIKLNMAIILLPMCKVLLLKLRNLTGLRMKSTIRQLFDQSVNFHVLCGITILLASVFHTMAHVFNYLNFKEEFTMEHMELNISQDQEEIDFFYIMATVPVITGVLMILILAIMFLTSMKCIRKTKFELFFYTHHLAFLFIAILLIHGFGGVMKYQTNTEAHQPGCEDQFLEDPLQCDEEPQFDIIKPDAWKYILGPIVIYIIDRLIRYWRGTSETKIVKALVHNDKVLEICMEKSGFTAKMGQYISIQCPDIAEFEWHPFTLTKCPSKEAKGDKTFSVHIAIIGKWTRDLAAALVPESKKKLEPVNQEENGNTCAVEVADPESVKNEQKVKLPSEIRLKVDGPYGAPSMDVMRFRHSICVGAGIGITPFASVLSHISSVDFNKKTEKLKKIHLIWISRNLGEYVWFIQLLQEAQFKLAQQDALDMLSCQIYVTKNIDPEFKVCCDRLPNTCFNKGRPDWKEMFDDFRLTTYRERIGVFYCGPKMVEAELQKECHRAHPGQNRFVLQSENFH